MSRLVPVDRIRKGAKLADGRVVHRILGVAGDQVLLCVHDPVPNRRGMFDKSTITVERSSFVEVAA